MTTAQNDKEGQPVRGRSSAGPRAQPHVVAIASGKGGVGKSSVAVNLGISLAKQGRRVCIFDADTGLANINILLGLSPRQTLEHVLFGARSIEEIMLEGPHGLKVIPGASGISQCVTLHPRQQLRLTRELARIEGEFDYLLLDTAAGIADNTLDFVCSAQTALVVITPEPTSLTDAFSLVKLLYRRRRSIDVQVLVNMCSSTNQAREIFHRFSTAVEKYIGLHVRYLGFLLRDESLRAAVTLQSPVALFPETDPSSRGFLRLAEALGQSLQARGTGVGFSGFWLRQFRERRGQGAPTRSKPASVPAPAPAVGDKAYLAELKSRLQLLMEREDGQQQVGQLLRELSEGYVQRFGSPPQDPLDVVGDLMTAPQRNDVLLRQLAQRLAPWRAEQAPPPAVAVVESPAVAIVGASGGVPPQLPLAVAESSLPHAYDTRRFGSQERLLELLRRHEGGRSVLELIDLL